ncbi:hypothetical protein AB0469_00870 [Streptomyces sp. NPDC093801]|uniref:hypothetical protein n=1 Tax=Streptomyces sp. NPDC093801 TaxID=3155203 RepID=UPI0034508D66
MSNLNAVDRAFLLVRRQISIAYPPGTSVPGTEELARVLRLPKAHVHRALRRLDTLGEISLHTGSLPVRLSPHEPHPRDRALHGAVRDRIRAGYYLPGQALATGLLGEEFRLRPHHVQRALRFLVAEKTLRFDEHGAYGPGHYVPVGSMEAVA